MTDKYGSIMYTTDRPDINFCDGKGSWLTDTQGRRYLDFVQGWAVNCLGHCPDVLNEALCSQAQRLWNASPAFYNAPQITLADKLAKASGLEKIFFTSTGAEANEGAIKLARKWGKLHRNGAYKIITMHASFHGRTLATMSATGKAAFAPLFNPKIEGFVKVPFNDLDACAAAIDDSVVAIMLEPIQGEAGVIPADPTYLKALAALCKQRGLLLIFDEVQTGIGRTGHLFAADLYNVRPDIMTLGKGLGGGAPLGALLASEAVACFEPGEQGGTFAGNALMTAVGNAVMDIVGKPHFLNGVRLTSDYLSNQLKNTFGENSVRGSGLLIAVELSQNNGKSIVDRALTEGLILNSPNESCLRFMPALNVSSEDIDKMISVLKRIL